MKLWYYKLLVNINKLSTSDFWLLPSKWLKSVGFEEMYPHDLCNEFSPAFCPIRYVVTKISANHNKAFSRQLYIRRAKFDVGSIRFRGPWSTRRKPWAPGSRRWWRHRSTHRALCCHLGLVVGAKRHTILWVGPEVDSLCGFVILWYIFICCAIGSVSPLPSTTIVNNCIYVMFGINPFYRRCWFILWTVSIRTQPCSNAHRCQSIFRTGRYKWCQKWDSLRF